MSHAWLEVERWRYDPQQAARGLERWRAEGVNPRGLHIPLPGGRALSFSAGNRRAGMAPSVMLGRWCYAFIFACS